MYLYAKVWGKFAKYSHYRQQLTVNHGGSGHLSEARKTKHSKVLLSKILICIKNLLSGKEKSTRTMHPLYYYYSNFLSTFMGKTYNMLLYYCINIVMRALGHEQISSSILGSTNDVENMIQYDRIIHMLLEARAKSVSAGRGGEIREIYNPQTTAYRQPWRIRTSP